MSPRVVEFVRMAAVRFSGPLADGHWWLLIFSCLMLVFALIAGQRSDVQLQFRAQSPTPGSLQIFFASDGHYSELKSVIWPVAANTDASVNVTIPTRETRALRIDPSVGMDELTLCDMRFLRSDGSALAVSSGWFKSTEQTQVKSADQCARLDSSRATDPQVTVDLNSLVPSLEQEQRVGTKSSLLMTGAGIIGLLAWLWLSRRGPLQVQVQRVAAQTTRAVPWIYLAIASVFGTAFAVLTPPGAIADEPAHIAKIILVENGHWLGADGVAATNPSMQSMQGPFGDYLNPAQTFTAASVFEHASRPLHCVSSSSDIPKSAARYSPTLYMPGAFVWNVVCRTGASTGSFIYGARLANLALAVLLTFIGLRSAGSLRWPLFALAVLPMTLFEQASLTADSMILGMSFCMIGIQAGLASGYLRPSWRWEAALLMVGLGLAVSKPGYAWLCVGFLLAFSAYRAISRAFWCKALVLVGVPWLIHLVWTISSTVTAVGRQGVSVDGNMQALATDPLKVVGLVFRTFFGDGSEFIWTSMIGRLGWLDVILHPASYSLAVLILVISGFMREGLETPPIRVRVLAVAAGIGSFLLFVIPMYLFWTPATAILIEGLQGRYFIPSAAFTLTWMAMRSPASARTAMAAFVFIAILAIEADAIYSLAHRYYS